MRPLRPAMLYGMDTRAAKEIDDFNAEFGEHYAAEIAGRPLSATSIGPKILWLKRNEPDVFNNTHKFFGAKSYLLYRLTGRGVEDYAAAKMAGIPYVVADMGWKDAKVLNFCGISAEQLPELAFATAKAGDINGWAAQQTGLKEGTPVAVGTGDFLAESLSYGTQFIGKPKILYGTTIGFDPGYDHAQILFEGFDPAIKSKFTPGGAMANGCSTIDWFITNIANNGDEEITRKEINVLAETMTPAAAKGLIVLPYFNGERIPINDPEAKGVIFGLRTSHTKADIYKAFLEGIAYSIRHVMEIRGFSDDGYDAVVMGGGTRNRILVQTVSDVTGLRQFLLKNFNGTLTGNAFIAGMACGMFSDRDEINKWVETEQSFSPNREYRETYTQGYMIYRELYDKTSGLMHKFNYL
jgi:xylulokinase